MKRRLVTAVMIVISALLAVTAVAEKKADVVAKEITWLSFDKGLAALAADSSGKHLFVDFTASWCGWCKRMEREAFSDSAVIAFVNENFIPVKVWGDSDNLLEIEGYKISERKLATGEFKVSGYPTFYFLTPDKAKVGPLRGYQTTENLQKALAWVKDREYETQMEEQQTQDQTENGQSSPNK